MVSRYDFSMTRPEPPWTPADERILATFANQYTIVAECACGHSREIFARPIQRQLGAGVTIGKVRDSLRCHRCQARRPAILVMRLPR
jgi:hypothetical protein